MGNQCCGASPNEPAYMSSMQPETDHRAPNLIKRKSKSTKSMPPSPHANFKHHHDASITSIEEFQK